MSDSIAHDAIIQGYDRSVQRLDEELRNNKQQTDTLEREIEMRQKTLIQLNQARERIGRERGRFEQLRARRNEELLRKSMEKTSPRK